MALCLIQPVTGGPADNFLSHTGHVIISNVDKLLQGCGVTEVSEMEAETFSQHLNREKHRAQLLLLVAVVENYESICNTL